MGDVPLALPVNSVFSYHYFRDADLAEMAGWGIRIVGDSGAFSAMNSGTHVDRDEFHAWAYRWRDALLWTAALDVIGNAEQSWINWLAAPSGLRLVPTIHYGAEPREMDRYADAGVTLMGLGGMVARKSEAPRLLRWALSIMAYAAKQWPDVRFHGWGVTHPELLENLPWWSVDSSGFSSAYRYGRLRLWDDKRRGTRTVALDGRSPAADRDLLREYGIDWQDSLRSVSDNRRLLVRAGLASLQRQERWLQARHHVTPPQQIVNPPACGPLIHGVDASRNHWRHIIPLEAP
jgi:hypothetical protein